MNKYNLRSNWLVLVVIGIVGYGIFNFINSLAYASNPDIQELWLKGRGVPITYSNSYIYTNFCASLVSGFYIFRGANWARYFYIVWHVFRFGVVYLLVDIPLLMLIELSLVNFIFFFTAVFILFSKRSREFFITRKS